MIPNKAISQWRHILHQFLAALRTSAIQNGYINTRGWISDDLKIAATAKSLHKLDIILTSDKNTFLPIALKMGLPCLAMFEDQFQPDLFGGIELS